MIFSFGGLTAMKISTLGQCNRHRLCIWSVRSYLSQTKGRKIVDTESFTPDFNAQSNTQIQKLSEQTV